MAGSARADQVVLVGGSTIEGKASRRGDKVVIEVDAGEIAIAASEVERIDSGTSVVQRYEAMRAKVGNGDVRGLMQLANFCRDHNMKERERELLRQVIEASADHAEARARLGYVRTDAGWLTREDVLRQRGYVQYDGHWVASAQLLEEEERSALTKAPAPRAHTQTSHSSEARPVEQRIGDMTAQKHGAPSAELAGAADPLANVR